MKFSLKIILFFILITSETKSLNTNMFCKKIENNFPRQIETKN